MSAVIRAISEISLADSQTPETPPSNSYSPCAAPPLRRSPDENPWSARDRDPRTVETYPPPASVHKPCRPPPDHPKRTLHWRGRGRCRDCRSPAQCAQILTS